MRKKKAQITEKSNGEWEPQEETSTDRKEKYDNYIFDLVHNTTFN